MRALLPPRSTPARDRALAELRERRWDLLVVGGGITGVAVARDAALRGLSVALIEQHDLAFGTSSRSSRLVHGGLRYLEELDFRLVREGLQERGRLLSNSGGLVWPVEFVYPVYAGDPKPLWMIYVGTRLYAALAGRYAIRGPRLLEPQAVAERLPGLSRGGLDGAVSYADAATHDARLTVGVARSAAAAGAVIVTRVRAAELLRRPAGVAGVGAEEVLASSRFEIAARATVLATGPWQDLHADIPPIIRTARGTHVAVARQRLPIDDCLALSSPRDGRLVFALPGGDHTVLGTTDEDDPVTPEDAAPTAGDVDYLLEAANHGFPAAGLRRRDVSGAWAGLRPLIADPGERDPDELSRRHEVVRGGPGLWILAGGKLTTHRRMAEDLVDAICEELAVEAPCVTATTPLFASPEDASATRPSLDGELVRCYGGAIGELTARLGDASAEDADALLAARIGHAVEAEWALSLDDLLLRRLPPGPLDLPACAATAGPVAAHLEGLLGWSRGETEAQIEELRARIDAELGAAGVDAS